MLLSRANASSRLAAGPTPAATDECVPHVESKAIDLTTTSDAAQDDTTVWEVKDAVTKTQKRPPATFALAGKPHTVTAPRKEKCAEPTQTKTSESTLDLLLQPIRALFPPAPPVLPLAPAFELKLPLSQKQGGKAGGGATTKLDGKSTDDEPFVIHQPASWSAKRPKLSAAQSAYTYDWKLNVFGDSPVAVKGQRTKYPKAKPLLPFIEREKKESDSGKNREAKSFGGLDFRMGLLNSSVMQGLPNRDRSGSLTSSSNLSFVSFASTSGSTTEESEYIITPFNSESQLAMTKGGACETDAFSLDDAPLQRLLDPLPEGIELAETLVSPTSAIRQRLGDMQVYDAAIFGSTESPNHDAMEEEEQEQDYPDSMPCTPDTPRSVPSDDSDSDA
ncbi:hypothetical protein CPB86DRAFT_799667 [Serendipita vermifera]|nr:hypothetical protein CPB86DRAFT_799667 [Serendipita vermifera]